MPPRRPQKSAEVILNSDDLLGLPILNALDKVRNNLAPAQQSDGSDPELDEDNDKANDDGEDEVSQRSPSPPPSKPRKRKHTEAVAKETGPAPKIHYQLKMATKTELHKPPTKRNNQGAMLLLDRSEPWDTFKAQLLCKISKCLKPTKENFNDYDVQFTIPRIITDPTQLASSDDYAGLLEMAPTTAKTTVNIFVCAKTSFKKSSNKENMSSGEEEGSSSSSSSESDGGRKKEKKKKLKKDKKKGKDKDGPGALESRVIELVKQLRERWQCSCPDSSAHCFWTAEQPEHFPLTNAHLRTWALALLQNDPTSATLEMPPNHIDFNGLPGRATGKRSPLLERRVRAMSNANKPEVAHPAFHLHLASPIPGPASGFIDNSVVPAPTAGPLSTVIKLLSGQGHRGPDMSVAAFCEKFELSNMITERLHENGYLRTKTFAHITIQQLEDMRFKSGEIASLQVAVDEWVSSA